MIIAERARTIRKLFIATTAIVTTAIAFSATSPPLAASWNIAPSGKASSSGELLFRVTPGNGDDPVEVTVFVLSGTSDTGVASNIRRALSTQLRAEKFNVESGAGANVLVTHAQGQPEFAVELIDSDVGDVRVTVQSTAPSASPTVPTQATPAVNPAPSATPPGPGDALPPADAAQPPAPPATAPPATVPPAAAPAAASPPTP